MQTLKNAMIAVTIHLANSASGEYDVRFPLPKPLHCTDKGLIARGGGDVVQVIGYASEIDSETADITWDKWACHNRAFDPDDVYGMFPVVICYDQIPATLTLPVTRVVIYGV